MVDSVRLTGNDVKVLRHAGRKARRVLLEKGSEYVSKNRHECAVTRTGLLEERVVNEGWTQAYNILRKLEGLEYVERLDTKKRPTLFEVNERGIKALDFLGYSVERLLEEDEDAKEEQLKK